MNTTHQVARAPVSLQAAAFMSISFAQVLSEKKGIEICVPSSLQLCSFHRGSPFSSGSPGRQVSPGEMMELGPGVLVRRADETSMHAG